MELRLITLKWLTEALGGLECHYKIAMRDLLQMLAWSDVDCSSQHFWIEGRVSAFKNSFSYPALLAALNSLKCYALFLQVHKMSP